MCVILRLRSFVLNKHMGMHTHSHIYILSRAWRCGSFTDGDAPHDVQLNPNAIETEAILEADQEKEMPQNVSGNNEQSDSDNNQDGPRLKFPLTLRVVKDNEMSQTTLAQHSTNNQSKCFLCISTLTSGLLFLVDEINSAFKS